MIGDSARTFGKRGVWIDVVKLGALDQHLHDRGPFTSAFEAGEEPRFAVECDAAQVSLGGVVGEADPSVCVMRVPRFLLHPEGDNPAFILRP